MTQFHPLIERRSGTIVGQEAYWWRITWDTGESALFRMSEADISGLERPIGDRLTAFFVTIPQRKGVWSLLYHHPTGRRLALQAPVALPPILPVLAWGSVGVALVAPWVSAALLAVACRVWWRYGRTHRNWQSALDQAIQNAVDEEAASPSEAGVAVIAEHPAGKSRRQPKQATA